MPRVKDYKKETEKRKEKLILALGQYSFNDCKGKRMIAS